MENRGAERGSVTSEKYRVRERNVVLYMHVRGGGGGAETVLAITLIMSYVGARDREKNAICTGRMSGCSFRAIHFFFFLRTPHREITGIYGRRSHGYVTDNSPVRRGDRDWLLINRSLN